MRILLSAYIILVVVLPPVYAASPEQSAIPTRYIANGSLDSINSIALLEVPNPAYYNFGETQDTGAFFFGIAGILAEQAAAGGDSKENGIFDFAKIIQEKLNQHLQDENYEIIRIGVNRKNKFGMIEDYNNFKIKGVDAFLDIAPVEVGYKQSEKLGGVVSSEIGPIISVVVRLISADTKKVLYADTIRYGWTLASVYTDLDIASPPEYQFKNMSDLKGNKERAIEQLIQGIDAVSMHIAGKLSKEPDAPLDSDDELLFVGKAAEEIATESYDLKLWEKSLSMANGDKVKRKGIYIKLRSSQLASQSKVLKTKPNDSPDAAINISGLYVSQITSTNSKYFKKKYRKLVIMLKQEGNNITGSNSTYNVEIWGTLEGDTISFDMSAHLMNDFQATSGKWEVNADGTRLKGTWMMPEKTGSGQWNLTKIQ